MARSQVNVDLLFYWLSEQVGAGVAKAGSTICSEIHIFDPLPSGALTFTAMKRNRVKGVIVVTPSEINDLT